MFMNDKALEAVYLFISELNGYKRGTIEGKIAFGKHCVETRKLPKATQENLDELIWLERLYKEMTRLQIHLLETGAYYGFHWSVPIELDASASMLGIQGALLGDKRLLSMTNMASDGKTLNDPWYIEGLSRNHVKKACTPRLYGSNQAVHALWKKAGLDFTLEELNLMNGQFREGAIGLADAFKEFVINNCNPKPEMRVKIFGEEFTIKCNHWKRVGDVPMSFDLFDSSTGRIRRVTHTKTAQVPDLERFRRYFQTLLIHSLDSRACDYVSGRTYEKYGFVIDVHDAYIVSPVAADDVRSWYCEYMDLVYANRQSILTEYFRSIGITASAIQAWNDVMDKVEPIEDGYKCSPYALK